MRLVTRYPTNRSVKDKKRENKIGIRHLKKIPGLKKGLKQI
jgi:hypothetical protein